MTSGTVSRPAVTPIADTAAQYDHKCEYHIRDLGTRSVTLYPSRAQIARDIKNVPLKVGTNQVVIRGLTPTLDENSVKIEGSGHALITNLVVELLPNREIFDNIYADAKDVDDKTDSDTDSEQDDDDDPELKAVLDQIRVLEDEHMDALEIVHSAESRMRFLEAFGNSVAARKEGHAETPVQDGLEIYREERALMFNDYRSGSTHAQDLQKQIQKLKKSERRRRKHLSKRRVKARVAKEKELEKKRREEAEEAKEKARVRKEQELYWPKKVFVITVHVDVKSVSDDDNDAVDATKTCDLTLSYATTHAFWSPTYNMSLSTTDKTGVLYFDACLTNQTSETWDKCSIALSTSRTELTGLNEPVPKLAPWNMALTTKTIWMSQAPATMYSNDEQQSGITRQPWGSSTIRVPRQELFGVERSSPQHHHHQGKPRPFGPNPSPFAQTPSPFAQAPAPPPTGGLFGATRNPNAGSSLFGQPAPAPPPASSLFGGQQQQQFSNPVGFGSASQTYGAAHAAGGLFGSAAPSNNNRGSGLFGNTTPSNNNNFDSGLFGNPTPNNSSNNTGPGGLFGNNSNPAAPQQPGYGQSPFGQVAQTQQQQQHAAPDLTTDSEAPPPASDDASSASSDSTPIAHQPDLSFASSNFEETGLTQTFSLRGLKTLSPSSTTSRHRVASLPYTSITFRRIAVPKLKACVFLSASIVNTSALTLPKAQAGITLDGSFLGRVPLQRCSAGDTFEVNLGVDPGVKVVYPKPEVKHGMVGGSSFLVGRNGCSVFTRCVRVVNTRGARGRGAEGEPEGAVQVTVLDQVPVSQDERLKVSIVKPHGLVIDGHAVPAGEGDYDSDDDNGNTTWGYAEAKLKKGGEIEWAADINPGCSAVLSLSYSCAFPTDTQTINS
ncbi:hypothetical protein F4808DRAFT_268591 [Astrocystis sublimbata]|nr:hypothetical protein F4808DRAFT_268591 [Astrocystis sublimbata]